MKFRVVLVLVIPCTLILLAGFTRPVAAQSHGQHFNIEAQPSLKPDFMIIALNKVNGTLDRKIMVFGIPVFAYIGVSDDNLLLVANVFAQWLDNDENGKVDHEAMLKEITNRNGYVFIVENQRQVETYNFLKDTVAYSLDAESIQKHWYTTGPIGDADGTEEESFHLIGDIGYGNLYPEIFGTRKDTAIADAMDVARGGHFERTPDRYLEKAWYTNPTKGCQYGCMVGEYFHWGIISILGANKKRGEHIASQWKLYTRDLVKEKDPRLYELLTKAEYKFPTRFPDGTYGR